MSFYNLKRKIEKIIDEEEYMFKETLTDDTILQFSTKFPKDWTKSNLKDYLKKRYDTLSLYCRSHCQQDELNEDKKFDTIEKYIEFYKVENVEGTEQCRADTRNDAEQQQPTIDNTNSITKDNN